MLNIFPYLKKYYSHKKLCWYFGTHTCMVNIVPGHVGYQTNVYTYVYRNSLISYNESRSCSHGVVGHLNRTCPGFCKDIELDGILNFEYLFRTVSRSTRRDDGGIVEVHFLFDYLYDEVVQCIYTLLGKKK